MPAPPSPRARGVTRAASRSVRRTAAGESGCLRPSDAPAAEMPHAARRLVMWTDADAAPGNRAGRGHRRGGSARQSARAHTSSRRQRRALATVAGIIAEAAPGTRAGRGHHRGGSAGHSRRSRASSRRQRRALATMATASCASSRTLPTPTGPGSAAQNTRSGTKTMSPVASGTSLAPPPVTSSTCTR